MSQVHASATDVSPKAKRVARWIFAGYALLIVTLTHWPALQVPGPGPRPDLIAHITAFGTWTAAIAWCGFFGPVASGRNLVWSVVVALAYAGLDEGTQAIPFFRRVCAWDDYFANASGILLAGLLMGVRLWWLGRRRAGNP